MWASEEVLSREREPLGKTRVVLCESLGRNTKELFLCLTGGTFGEDKWQVSYRIRE